MVRRRRVTLRCLCDDLTTDWTDTGQQRAFRELHKTAASDASNSEIGHQLDRVPTTSLAAHPLVTSYFRAFDPAGTETRRESISGLASPHWWKQKTSRWRGAATDADVVCPGEVWLCAGGLRAAGDIKDFYREFTDAVMSEGPVRYLPTPADRRVQDVEEFMARQAAWLDQLRLATLVCITDCASNDEPRMQHVAPPSPPHDDRPLTHLEFLVETINDAGESLSELTITVRDQDWSRRHLLTSALNAVRSVIEPAHENWRALPGPEGIEIWATLLSAERLSDARKVVEAGVLPEEVAGSHPKLGLQAHYTRSDGIVGATIEGDAVEALCGRWFVPTANPDSQPVCPTCQAAYATLPN